MRDYKKLPLDAMSPLTKINPKPGWSSFRLKMKKKTSTCAQFCEDSNKCGIYENRPYNCSGYQKGGYDCAEAIRAFDRDFEKNNHA